MARGLLGAAYTVGPDIYNKGVQDELNLQALQRANTARRMITSDNTFGVTEPAAYQNPYDRPIQEQGRLMPDPEAGGQYMTVPGSQQDVMLRQQDADFPQTDSLGVPPQTRQGPLRQGFIQQQYVGTGIGETFTAGDIASRGLGFQNFDKLPSGLYVRKQQTFGGEQDTTTDADRQFRGGVQFSTSQPGDPVPGMFTGVVPPSDVNSFGVSIGGADAEPEPTKEETEKITVANTGKQRTITKSTLSEELEDSNNLPTNEAETKVKSAIGTNITMRENQVLTPSSGLGTVAQQMIDDRKFITAKIMRNERLAEIYRRVGDSTSYITTLNAAQELRQELKEYDNAITLAIGKDALADLNYSNNASRVSQVLSKLLNRNVQIVPNSYDDKYTMFVDGQVREQGLTVAQMTDRVNSLTDASYRQQKRQARIKRAELAFKGQIDKDKEIATLLGNLKIESLKGKVQIMIERIKQDNTLQLKSFNDGTAILQTGPGQFMFFDPMAPDPLNEGGTMPIFKRLSVPITNTSADAYKAKFDEQ